MRKTTEAEQRQYIDECRASGKSARAWCREKGIPYTTYGNWVKTKAHASSCETAQKVSWATVVAPAESSYDYTPQPAAASQPRIRIKSGSFEIMVEQGFDLDLLRRVLRAVSSACC